MTLLSTLPDKLEDATKLIERRQVAANKKEYWRSTYRDAYQYAMPTRETFNWYTEGMNKESQLYDSTLQESTSTAANTLVANLFPTWARWAEISAGGDIEEDEITPEMTKAFQSATRRIFTFLHTSNFQTVINEAALDLQIGTAALSFDEGDMSKGENLFKFTAIPLPVIEIEEGPDGSVETTWMLRKPLARNLLRMYPGMELFDLSEATQTAIDDKPDTEIEIIQGEVFHPDDRCYYGIVIELAAKQIVWRYKYGESSPTIVARASKVAGETYGRGRVLIAMRDAKTLDKAQQFVLMHMAMQVAPPLTAVSDDVFNPYTATLTPNTIIPVASNDKNSPSLMPLNLGGNFNVTETQINNLRDTVRRIMLGPEPTAGPVKSATEINVNDRNRLWAMNGEYGRIQTELLSKILMRAIFLLKKNGLFPKKLMVNGRDATIRWTSPFAKSQASQDLMDLQEGMQIASTAGEQAVQRGIKVEAIPEYVFKLKGLPAKLVRTPTELKKLDATLMQGQAAQAQMQMQSGKGGKGGGQPPPPQPPPPGPNLASGAAA